MNQKQKLGYMVLGAVILAVGIIIGQVITPDIEAQSNGVFDKIICKEIEVVDKDGNTGILLVAGEPFRLGDEETRLGNAVIIDQPNYRLSRTAVSIVALDNGSNGLHIFDDRGDAAITVRHKERANLMSISNPQGGGGILLASNESRNSIRIKNKQGDKDGIRLFCIEEEGHGINVFDQHQELGAGLYAGAKELGNGVFSVDTLKTLTILGD